MDLPWNDGEISKSMEDLGIVEDLLGHENEGGLFSEMVLPYFSPIMETLMPTTDCQGRMPIKNIIKPKMIDPGNIISSGADVRLSHDGLALSSSDVMEKLDFVITQMDISRMERTASCRLQVEDIHQLPTVTYDNDRSDVLICPPCNDIIENKIQEDEKQINQGQVFDDTQVWSWMMVPRDTSREVSRIIGTNWSDVPKSISIASSLNDEEMHPSFDHCVICRAHFQEGDILLTLPCEHLLHSTCVCSNKILEVTLSGCPMCKRKVPRSRTTSSSEHSSKNTNEQAKSPSHSDSDGSLPSWAFVNLGNLLSSKGT